MMMSLAPPPPSTKKAPSAKTSLKGGSSARRRKARVVKSLKPNEYATAVGGYADLPNGSGENYIQLRDFLKTEPNVIQFPPHSYQDDFVILYPLGPDENTAAPPASSTLSRQAPSDSEADHDSMDERRHEARRSIPFQDPHAFYRDSQNRNGPQSHIIFLRGYLSAAWIKNIGGGYFVDPEFFCRHLDFRPANDSSNNFSTPALPSTSWYLMELPVITIGMRSGPRGPLRTEKIEELRKQGAEALERHHGQIAELSSSRMTEGESMIRDFYVFDETHFAVEQRISVCMQPAESGDTFSLLVWLDSGADLPNDPPFPWSIQPPESHYFPTILHRHMIALKGHLISSEDADPSARSASHLPTDYGRSLHPAIMAGDAFYSLTEVISFAASSEMAFLNLLSAKLDRYTSLPAEQYFQSLPNLKYVKQILGRHARAVGQVLSSIRNAEHPRWPRDSSRRRAAETAARGLEQDFAHLAERVGELHGRAAEAVAVLMSSVSISESQKAIEQAERVGKLTLMAFVFVPLSFTTSLFGMNVVELAGGKLGLKWWFAVSAPVTAAAVALYFVNVETLVRRVWTMLKSWWSEIGKLD